MILGPLPISRWTVVGAKLAAMAAFLLGTSLSINLVTALPFSLVSSTSPIILVRNFGAHMIATSCAAIFMFSVIVMLRSAVGMMTRGHLGSAAASLLQFLFISALLCFIILVPTTMNVTPRGRGMGMSAYVATVPGWMPTNWFAAMYVTLRGTAEPGLVAIGGWAALLTVMGVAGAGLLTLAGYTRQLQLALTPLAWTGTIGRALVSRTVAGLLVGSNRAARAVSEFILMTIARNRAQQAPIAINAAIGLGLLIIKFARYRHDLTMVVHAPPPLLMTVPLMLTFWAMVGVRASFFVPSELPASWSFRTNARATTSAYALATRAAIVGLVGPAAVVASLGLGFLAGGWPLSLFHAAFTLLLVVVFADFIALTIVDIPFTRPYQPGHSRLKTRWPLYLFGAYGFSDGLTGLELYAWNDPQERMLLLLSTAVVVGVFEWGVRRSGRAWTINEIEIADDSQSSVIVLDLGAATPKSA